MRGKTVTPKNPRKKYADSRKSLINRPAPNIAQSESKPITPNASVKTREFLPYIHNLRALAIFFVVGVHARGFSADWASHPEARNFFEVIFDSIEGNGTIMFVFIGGFLFQHLTHNHFQFATYLRQKFKVIILPYLLISIPLIAIRLFSGFESLSLPEDFNNRTTAGQVIHFLITGAHMPPFWFINMIILIYLSAPLLHAIDHKKFYTYIFPLVFLITFFTYRSEHNANPLLAYIHFIPIYIAGMFTSFYKDRILSAAKPLTLLLAGIYVAITALQITGIMVIPQNISIEQVIAQRDLIFNIAVFKALTLCLLVMLILYHYRNREMPVFRLLGDYSFGIFFIHYIFISVSRKLIENIAGPIDFTVPGFIAYYSAIVLLSTATVYLIKKTSGNYSRMLIGS